MRELILEKLEQIEARENVRILHAVESGSRAWGFASPDSDYDVRFIYVRRPEDYLRLDDVPDVIELPINDLLDINGWDLNKALRLLHNSNPTLIEWFNSPVVYRRTEFAGQIRPLLDQYFSVHRGLNHYLSTCTRTVEKHLVDDFVKAKKYFYALRPLLACKWILERRTAPPILFRDLLDAYPDEAIMPDVERLLELKINAPEIKKVPRVDALNDWLKLTIAEIRQEMALLPPEEPADWEMLNRFFREKLYE